MLTDNYKEEVTEDISQCLATMSCQPILFIGSGLSRRYFNAPNWEELLQYMAKQCPLIDKEFPYYKQQYNKDMVEIGTYFAERYREWAWGLGKKDFKPELFNGSVSREIYLKDKVASFFEEITPKSVNDLASGEYLDEIKALQRIQPHSIITTNYDRFLEVLFPDYEPVVGQKVLYGNYASVGEIFKIHGTASLPESLVLTHSDYDEFMRKKKYLSSKLFTFFAEHPLLIIGYNAQDANIRSILSDIDELLSEHGELVENIYFLEREENSSIVNNPSREKLIDLGENRSLRIKSITSSDFKWIFESFGDTQEINRVNPKHMRALLARAYELVRRDIPQRRVEIDYGSLESALENRGEFAKLFGVSILTNPSATNANWSYLLSAVAEQLGYNYWFGAKKLLQRIEAEKGVNIQETDNRYHIRVKTGKNSFTGKYSQALVDLLRRVKDGEDYEVNMDSSDIQSAIDRETGQLAESAPEVATKISFELIGKTDEIQPSTKSSIKEFLNRLEE